MPRKKLLFLFEYKSFWKELSFMTSLDDLSRSLLWSASDNQKPKFDAGQDKCAGVECHATTAHLHLPTHLPAPKHHLHFIPLLTSAINFQLFLHKSLLYALSKIVEFIGPTIILYRLSTLPFDHSNWLGFLFHHNKYLLVVSNC